MDIVWIIVKTAAVILGSGVIIILGAAVVAAYDSASQFRG